MSKALLQYALETAHIIRVSNQLSHPTFMNHLLLELRRHFAHHTTLSTSEFKEISRLSRKFSIPLLEWLDENHKTRRNGDVRISMNVVRGCINDTHHTQILCLECYCAQLSSRVEQHRQRPGKSQFEQRGIHGSSTSTCYGTRAHYRVSSWLQKSSSTINLAWSNTPILGCGYRETHRTNRR